MSTRCKFKCMTVLQREHCDKSKGEHLYDVEFEPVMDGSEENKSFWAYTPAGRLSFSSVVSTFVAGKEYYLDITEVPLRDLNADE